MKRLNGNQKRFAENLCINPRGENYRGNFLNYVFLFRSSAKIKKETRDRSNYEILRALHSFESTF